jgi:hypothetical protein
MTDSSLSRAGGNEKMPSNKMHQEGWKIDNTAVSASGSDNSNDEKDTEIARIFDHIQLLQKKVESLEQYILHHMINTSETHADDVLAIAPENGGKSEISGYNHRERLKEKHILLEQVYHSAHVPKVSVVDPSNDVETVDASNNGDGNGNSPSNKNDGDANDSSYDARSSILNKIERLEDELFNGNHDGNIHDAIPFGIASADAGSNGVRNDNDHYTGHIGTAFADPSYKSNDATPAETASNNNSFDGNDSSGILNLNQPLETRPHYLGRGSAERARQALSERPTKKFPRDSYSVLFCNGPTEDGWSSKRMLYAYFGFHVFFVQITFLLLLTFGVLKEAVLNDSFNLTDDMLVITAQVLSLFSYCTFIDSSLYDFVEAVQQFPRISNREANNGFRVGWLRFCCVLKGLQGFLCFIPVVLLVTTSQTVDGVVLNFSAINFISSYGELIFSTAETGSYGHQLREEVRKIEKLDLPLSMQSSEKRSSGLVKYFIIPVGMAAAALVAFGVIDIDALGARFFSLDGL